jgi:endo-1,4-beta-xylanase Y
MRKRILSLLLALTLALSAGVFGVIPALAADSCVSVKADAVTTGEVVAGSLLEIKLTDVFEDTDGHTLTYTLTNAAQFSAQTKVKDGSLYVSEKDPGTYEPKVKATCSDGKELTATFTITVTKAPHGLDAQYNYDETPAKEVTVYVTISNDGVPIRGRDGTVLCHKAITVPYFDLGRYNLSEYYRYHTENGEGKYIDENIVERPTGLHLYLYLLERYFIGLPEEQCCKGAYPRDALASFKLGEDVSYMDETPAYTADSFAALTITGSPTSLYMANFWGHDENLMYYRNHCFPYMSPGWGSTSDYIVLSDGDTWDVAMFTNWSFWSSGGAFTCFDKDAYNARPGMELTVNTQAYGTTFEGSDFYPFSNLDVFLYNDKWEEVNQYKKADDGKSTFSFTAPTEEGTYYLVGMDPNRTIPKDDSGGTNYAKIAPATAILNVAADAELERPFQDAAVNDEKLAAKNTSYEGITTLTGADGQTTYKEVPKYHVTVPEGAETVTVTYNKDVDICHDGATVYAYEVEFAATAVNRAAAQASGAMALREDSLRLAVNRAAAQASGYTLKPITLENSYTRNTDGTQTVVMPVTGYVRNADGSGKAITLSAPADKNSAPVALFTFEYAKADTKPDVTYGDVNGDGIINSTDAAIVYRSVNGRYTLTDSQKLSADVNGDGAVNSTDAALIYRYTNGKMSKFPAES